MKTDLYWPPLGRGDFTAGRTDGSVTHNDESAGSAGRTAGRADASVTQHDGSAVYAESSSAYAGYVNTGTAKYKKSKQVFQHSYIVT